MEPKLCTLKKIEDMSEGDLRELWFRLGWHSGHGGYAFARRRQTLISKKAELTFDEAAIYVDFMRERGYMNENSTK